MRKNPADPGQSDQPDPVSQRRIGLRARTRIPHLHITGQRVVLAVIALSFLLISATFSLSELGLRTSYASPLISHVPNDCTTTPTDCTPTPVATTPTVTATATNTPTAVPTKKPTKVPTKVPTQGGVTATPTTAAQASATAGVSPTASTTDVSPTPGATVTGTTVPTGNTGGSNTPKQSGSGGGGSRVVVIVGGVVVLLLLGLLVGWFFFRRMLLPQGAPNSSLPPSGARPWSRTRAPNPDSMGGIMAAGPMGNPGPGGPGSPNPNMFAGGFDAFPGAPVNNGGGFNGPGPQGGNGAGFGGFSDGFIPPSPQVFQQGENSMIPPGSGAFPVIGNANGFAPASQAFNAMYGLPDDPFAGSQAGSPSWMSNLNNNNGFGGPPPDNRGSFAPGLVDLNDPHLAEVIRQYSQKSQSVQPQPQQQQQMPPNGPPQQMSPNRPQQQMPFNGPPQQMSPNRPPQQMPPARPQQPPPIPQREPRKGFQDSHWLQ